MNNDATTATAEARTAILEALYAAFNARDVDAVIAKLAPDVDWPNVIEGTRALGHAAVRTYWQGQFERIAPHVEPLGFTPRGDSGIVVDVHQVVRDLVGTVLRDGRVAHAYTFDAEDLVSRMDVFDTVEAAIEAA